MAKRGKFNTPLRKQDKPMAFGEVFDSALERDRAIFLMAAQQGGLIYGLEFHPKFTLVEAFEDNFGQKYKAATYTADFSYIILESRQGVVEQVKGGKATQTDASRLRQKLFARLNPTTWHRVITSATEEI